LETMTKAKTPVLLRRRMFAPATGRYHASARDLGLLPTLPPTVPTSIPGCAHFPCPMEAPPRPHVRVVYMDRTKLKAPRYLMLPGSPKVMTPMMMSRRRVVAPATGLRLVQRLGIRPARCRTVRISVLGSVHFPYPTSRPPSKPIRPASRRIAISPTSNC
jgi:hypothetical protein